MTHLRQPRGGRWDPAGSSAAPTLGRLTTAPCLGPRSGRDTSCWSVTRRRHAACRGPWPWISSTCAGWNASWCRPWNRRPCPNYLEPASPFALEVAGPLRPSRERLRLHRKPARPVSSNHRLETGRFGRHSAGTHRPGPKGAAGPHSWSAEVWNKLHNAGFEETCRLEASLVPGVCWTPSSPWSFSTGTSTSCWWAQLGRQELLAQAGATLPSEPGFSHADDFFKAMWTIRCIPRPARPGTPWPDRPSPPLTSIGIGRLHHHQQPGRGRMAGSPMNPGQQALDRWPTPGRSSSKAPAGRLSPHRALPQRGWTRNTTTASPAPGWPGCPSPANDPEN